jgi:hypothetical protein
MLALRKWQNRAAKSGLFLRRELGLKKTLAQVASET